ncbi:MAG TPA: type VI secretion system-associated FHA domain protein TagH, partial [Rubrivivax sp.]|nr:type VI secretion system-associated FHA domain protein TagH [Rubrivivax sp.]
PSSADAAALLAAFREGLATPSVQLDVMTPELMRLIGELLRESARGTVELLVARAAVKREVRAAATMIVARENNPLKFSPSGDAALAHLLA